MRLGILLVIALVLLPLAFAASSTTTGWYYTGDTFKVGGTVFSVEGEDWQRVLLGVGGNLYFIENGTCRDMELSKYCYLNTAYPSDDDHIKYAAGHQYFGYYLSINQLEPKIEVTREASDTNPKLGDTVSIKVVVSNTGDYNVNYLTYNETIPAGFSLLSMPGGTFTYQAKTLNAGSSKGFSYSIKAVDYVSGNLQPNITYAYGTHKYNLSVTPLAFLVDIPLAVTHYTTSSLNIGDQGIYALNISNNDDNDPMTAFVVIRFPSELYELGVQGLSRQSATGDATTYNTTLQLKPGKNASLRIDFGSSYSGTYHVQGNITATIGGTTFHRYYEDTVSTNSNKIIPTIRLSSGRTVFRPGEQVTVMALLRNTNANTTFSQVGGLLSGRGLFNDTKFNHDSFMPGKNITEAEIVAVMPNVVNSTPFTITLSGRYKTPAGEFLLFSENKTITVELSKDIVTLTRTVTPVTGVLGSNITVTVTATNIYNQYVTFTAHEIYDPMLTRIGGLSFAETSLERDATQQLYAYQLAIPENYTSSINLTTNVLPKGEALSTRSSTIVPVIAAPSPSEQNATANNSANGPQQNATGAENAPKKKLGFFASIWDFLTNLFS